MIIFQTRYQGKVTWSEKKKILEFILSYFIWILKIKFIKGQNLILVTVLCHSLKDRHK